MTCTYVAATRPRSRQCASCRATCMNESGAMLAILMGPYLPKRLKWIVLSWWLDRTSFAVAVACSSAAVTVASTCQTKEAHDARVTMMTSFFIGGCNSADSAPPNPACVVSSTLLHWACLVVCQQSPTTKRELLWVYSQKAQQQQQHTIEFLLMSSCPGCDFLRHRQPHTHKTHG